MLSLMFTGHRELEDSEAIRANLHILLPAFYAKGYRAFISGGALGFDTVAALEVLRFSETVPDVKLCLALSSHDQTRGWTKGEIAAYNWLISRSATHTFVSEHGSDSSVYRRRNYFMVDHSNYCIAYLHKAASGTAMTVNYANRVGLPVVNIGEAGFDAAEFVRNM